MINISKLYCGFDSPSDRLRYGAPRSPLERRPVVVWNSTRRCNLHCAHCYSGSDNRSAPDELSTDEARALIRDLANFGVPVLLFSGGEPLLRPDLPELLREADTAGLRTVLSTNGTCISENDARMLLERGVKYVGISLDGIGDENDRFRGVDGAFESALAGIRACQKAGVKTGLRFTVHAGNAQAIPAVFELLERETIPRVCFYHLVATGRGRGLDGAALDSDVTRRVVDQIIDRTADLHRRGRRVEVLTVDNHADGPYLYLRLLREQSPRAPRVLELLRRAGGNASGVGIGCVSWDGTVYPDQFWRSAGLGNVRDRPFSALWMDLSNPRMTRLKEKKRYVTGRCAACRFLDVCGGNLRARAEALTGDPWAADPGCYLSDAEIGVATPLPS